MGRSVKNGIANSQPHCRQQPKINLYVVEKTHYRRWTKDINRHHDHYRENCPKKYLVHYIQRLDAIIPHLVADQGNYVSMSLARITEQNHITHQRCHKCYPEKLRVPFFPVAQYSCQQRYEHPYLNIHLIWKQI